MTWHGAARTAGGLAAVAGGVMWGVKSVSILVLDHQPPLVFEVAVPLFGVTVGLLATDGRRRTWQRRCAQALGGLACVAGTVAVVTELVGELWGPAIATAMLAVILGLVLNGVARPPGSRLADTSEGLALAIGLSTVPSIILGGVLSMLDERLLEVPLLILACLWTWLGATMILRRNAVEGLNVRGKML